jgi:hypothetical protein
MVLEAPEGLIDQKLSSEKTSAGGNLTLRYRSALRRPRGKSAVAGIETYALSEGEGA